MRGDAVGGLRKPMVPMTDARPKIVIVTSYPFEDTNAAKARVGSFRAALAPLGQVFVLAPKGVTGAVDDGLVPVGFAAHTHRSFVRRGLSELQFALKLRRHLHTMAPDIAVVTIPSMFLLAISGTSRFPVVVDIRDLVWDYLPDQTLIQRFAKLFLTRWSLFCLTRATAITVTNGTEKNHLVETAATARPPVVIANGISAARFAELSSELGERMRSQGLRRRVLYVGNVGIAQDIETLVRAAAKRPELDFTIVGKGNDLPRIMDLITELRLTNVELTGGKNWGDLLDYYRNADVLYAQVGTDYATAVPSKLAEYMTVGRPVIFGGIGASAAWLSRFSGVKVVAPSDAAALSDALADIDALAGQIDVAANRRLVEENYIRDHQAKAMRDIVETVLADGGAKVA